MTVNEIWILSRVPLSQAYPWVAVGLIVVLLLGWYLYGKRLARLFWVGFVLIMAGALLVQYGAPSQ